MTKPKAVLISDIHFTLPTLELATASLQQAMDKAYALNVPLVLCGDTLDSKSIIRGEISNRLIQLLGICPSAYVLVGNHDLLNEKSREHSLNFLRPYCRVIDSMTYDPHVKSWFFPYHNDSDSLRLGLENVPEGDTIIMHQGLQSADMGHYVQDKTSLPREAFADFRVISGHYHRRQDIKCGHPRKGAVGLFSYVGNPYSLSFGEANDGEKGFQVLNEDGTLNFIPTGLRKHIILERTTDTIFDGVDSYQDGDLVWVKVTGPRAELDKLSKKEIGSRLLDTQNFKLDRIYTDSVKSDISEKRPDLTDYEILDRLIDDTSESVEQKTTLKGLWREVYEAEKL